MILTALKGAAMGVAEAIPGVSGGTIAFISGIYERILNCIRAFSPALWTTFRREGLRGVWAAIDGTFLLFLLMGMAAGLVGGVFGVSYLLRHYPVLVWSFFFGLILASAFYIGRSIPRWRLGEVLSLLTGAGLAFGITLLPVMEQSTSLVFIFVSGALAISALMLPGISGSFVLLLLGMYQYIIDSVRAVLSGFSTEALLVCAVFAMGCLTGLLSFSRLLAWLFRRYRTLTFAAMTGFMLGALNKIWPWHVATQGYEALPGGGQLRLEGQPLLDRLNDPHSKIKVLQEQNLLPYDYEALTQSSAMVWQAILLMAAGLLLVFVLSKLDDKKDQIES